MNNQQKSNNLRAIIKTILNIGNATIGILSPMELSESAITNIASDVLVEFIEKRLLGLNLTKEEQDDFRKRAQIASKHLTDASNVLTELQDVLNKRTKDLDLLLSEIDTKRIEAEHWQEIASVNEGLAQALTKEIEKRVQQQIRAELDRNKTRKQLLGIIGWIFTLIISGFVGAYIQYWVTASNLFK